MCHLSLPGVRARRTKIVRRLGGVAIAVHLNFADAYLREALAVALQLLVLLLPLEVEDQNLVAAPFGDHGAEHFGGLRLYERSGIAGEGENVAKFNRAVLGRLDRFDLHDVAGSNPVLLSTC